MTVHLICVLGNDSWLGIWRGSQRLLLGKLSLYRMFWSLPCYEVCVCVCVCVCACLFQDVCILTGSWPQFLSLLFVLCEHPVFVQTHTHTHTISETYMHTHTQTYTTCVFRTDTLHLSVCSNGTLTSSPVSVCSHAPMLCHVHDTHTCSAPFSIFTYRPQD